MGKKGKKGKKNKRVDDNIPPKLAKEFQPRVAKKMGKKGKKGRKNKRVDDNIPPKLAKEFQPRVAKKMGKMGKKVKKNERADDNNPPKLPDEFKKVIMKAQGERIKDEILVIEKHLTASDVEPTPNGFTIPSELMQNKFLTDAEENLLKLPKENGKELNDIPVNIVEPICELNAVSLQGSIMKGEKPSYRLTTRWNLVVQSSKLEEGQLVQLWAIRVGFEGKLWFALVRLPFNGSDSQPRGPLPSNFIFQSEDG